MKKQKSKIQVGAVFVDKSCGKKYTITEVDSRTVLYRTTGEEDVFESCACPKSIFETKVSNNDYTMAYVKDS